jgi:protein-L-isoaspartate(D-aspartate) O-methyltransferase
MADYSARRLTMVDTQVRPHDVTSFSVINAMLSVPKELYVPGSAKDLAYIGGVVDLGAGRCVADARLIGKVLEILDITPGELVLDLGCSQGYTTALIAQLAQAVVGVDCRDDLTAEAETTLSAQGIHNAIIVKDDIAKGAAKHGPYDVITIFGGVETIPPAIVGQLKDGGRIAAVFMNGALGEVKLGHKANGVLSWRMAFNAAAPVLPGFEKKIDFVL